MASTRALNLPDILRITFAFLSSKSLFACAQVNSIWAEEATDILWRTPPVSALVSLAPSGRAQMYADKIIKFITNYHGPDDIGALQAFPQISLPRLRVVSCLRADLACTQWLLQHLQPSLRKFSLGVTFGSDLNDTDPWDDEVTDAILMRLSNKCLHLQEIYFDLHGLNRGGLLEFLETTPSLKSIKLDETEELETDLLQHLAARPNLMTLEIKNDIWGDTAAPVAASTMSPFADLIILRCRSEEATLKSFTPHMQKLRVLDVHLKDRASTSFAAIAYLSDLRVLTVAFEYDSAIRGLDLVSLAEGCQRLRVLSLYGVSDDEDDYYSSDSGPNLDHWRPGAKLDGIDINDEHLCSLSSLLPYLEEIRLPCWGRLSTMSLYHLGRNCPSLRVCELSACVLNVSNFFRNPRSEQSMTSGSNLSGSQQPGEVNHESTSAISQDAIEPWQTEQTGADVNLPLFPKLRSLEIQRLIKYKTTSIDKIVSCLFTRAPRLVWFRTQLIDRFHQNQKVEEAFRRHIEK